MEIGTLGDPAADLSPSDDAELVRARNLEEIEHLLTAVRMTDYSDPEHYAHVENLLIAIVTHLKGDEIQ